MADSRLARVPEKGAPGSGEAETNSAVEAERHQRTLSALAEVDSGCLIDDEAMQAWADSLGTGHELPVPQPG